MMESDVLWQTLRSEAQTIAASEPVLASYVHSVVLRHHNLLEVMSFHLARLLDSTAAPALLLREVCAEAFHEEPAIIRQVSRDMVACYERDAACDHYLMPLLYFKGFHALQSYRVAHWLWQQGRRMLALHIQSRMSEVFAVDIHPAAVIGSGILMDHATGVVIGETAVIEDDVSMLHEVTLGGSGRMRGCRRHPLIRRGVLLATGAKILGPVEIGEGAKIGGGSVVLTDIPPHSTAAGVPAKIVGKPAEAQPALDMDQKLNEVGDEIGENE
ncbi:MAG TPA: serine O-acetyltransferase [Pseudomonadales bacterium]|jgi:serine O-acetyltransferase|nr:serine O-acetyltransferase [Pseudomonadales bacterium]